MLRETGPATSKPFGFCARFDLASIGATKVSQRTFTLSSLTRQAGGPIGSAAEQLARFPDATAVHRAAAVLTAWHHRCQGAMMGPITGVPVSNGAAWWYVASTRLMDHAFGAVLRPRTMALVRLDIAKSQLGRVGIGAMGPVMSLAAVRMG